MPRMGLVPICCISGPVHTGRVLHVYKIAWKSLMLLAGCGCEDSHSQQCDPLFGFACCKVFCVLCERGFTGQHTETLRRDSGMLSASQ